MAEKRTAAETALRINGKLERFMPLLTPIGASLGIFFPDTFIVLRPLAPWLFSVMTLSGALKLRAKELGAAVKNPLPVLLFFLTAHALMPAAVRFIAAFVFRGDLDIIAGYVLLYAVPTAVTGFIWCSIFHGDPALSLALILLDTLASPLVVPASVLLLLGTEVVMDMSGIVLSLVLMVVVPTVIGVGINEASRGAVPRVVSPFLTPFSKFCVLCVIAANSAAVAPQVHFGSARIWLIVACCIVFIIAGFCLARLTGVLSRLNRARTVSVFFASGLRNTTAAMTIAIEFFPPGASLPAVLGIIFQQSLAAIMGKLLIRKEP